MKPKFFVYFLISLAGCAATALTWKAIAAVVGRPAAAPSIIPVPQSLERKPGTFTLQSDTRIIADNKSEPTAIYLAEKLRSASGFALPVSIEPNPNPNPNPNPDPNPTPNPRPQPGAIVLLTTAPDANPGLGLGPEGYELEIAARGVTIRGSAQAGIFYGVQSFLQLLPPQVFAPAAAGAAGAAPGPGPGSLSSDGVTKAQAQSGRGKDGEKLLWTAPCLTIRDRPRFPWRGYLLDVARHFFSPQEVKQLLDVLALHKINICQLHLTDDQGWRVEISKYPRLTQVGAWRKSIGFNLDPKTSQAYGPDGRYGGFYTQKDIRDLVAYAQSRHITLIPEIEMPGHASAALAAYPEYSCSGGPYTTDMSAGVFAGVYCAGREETYQFLADILGEVGELFPGQYIHIGGDEVPKQNWKGCARCQALMQREGLKNEHELQSYFVRRIEKILNSQGRRLIGWSEIREGGLAQNATVMDWIGGGLEAAKAGHDVVMTPTSHCYFDYYQSRNRTNEPPAIGAFLPLKTVYSLEPIPKGLEPALQPHILGTQGNVWTEYIPSLRQVQYMTFPRLCALAEVGWSPKDSRNWADFIRRLEIHTNRLSQLGVNYRPGFFEE